VSSEPRGGRAANKPTSDRPTKDERKEQARAEREEIRARMGARRRNRTAALIVGLVVAAAVVALVVILGGGGEGPGDGGEPTDLAGMLTTDAPWPNNTEQLSDRLRVLGLPGVSEVVNHLHVGLSIFINGEPVPIPAEIGLSQTAFSPIHTHAEDGILHVEADDPDYVPMLGQAFDVWGVRLTGDCIGGHCVGADNELRVFVDGEEFTGDPRTLVLEDNVRVVIAFGSEDQLPDPIPTDPPIAT
jgi:hypothetical protein